MIFRIVVLASYILIGALVGLKYWVLPAARREEAFFGIRISCFWSSSNRSSANASAE